jgi:1,4-dihydroxy-2-naphthoate polyprenyltransferase
MLKQFLSYVEIGTKLASIMPALLGLFYVRYAYGPLNWVNTMLFLLSMICFDMATTALNNYMDARVNGAPLQFSIAVARVILFILLILATASGLLLVTRTNLIVLACGAICFLVGIVYTAGPAPIAHMPLGEAFSGLFMGFFIPFLAVLINVPSDSLLNADLSGWTLNLAFNLEGLLRLAILSIPAICGIANIMLANNICDLSKDVANKRFTLPYYIGIRPALRLFAMLYGLAFLAVIAIVVLGILPVYVLAVLIAMMPVWRNIARFNKKQSKQETFPLSVHNFMLIMGPLVLLALAAAMIR